MALKVRMVQVAAAALTLAGVASAQAQEVVLKLHHMWPTMQVHLKPALPHSHHQHIVQCFTPVQQPAISALTHHRTAAQHPAQIRGVSFDKNHRNGSRLPRCKQFKSNLRR